MDSTVGEGGSEFVAGRKLYVYLADNGHGFEFECDGSTPVEAVQSSIEEICGVQINDQLILCDDKKLESNRLLSSYKLPRDDAEAFLYNRSHLLVDSQPPDPEKINVPDFVEPTPPSPSRFPHALDDAPDPALKALPSYERQFRYHYQRGRAVFGSTVLKFETCQRLLREQRIQVRSIETARGSLDHGYRMVHQHFTEFIKCYTQQHRYHWDILMNLRRDIEKLRSCELHPALQTETKKCLLDLINEDNVKNKAENAANSHRQFEGKVLQLKSMFGELKRRMEELCADKAKASIVDLESMITDYHRYVNEQNSIMQSLSKDVDTVKKLVDDCVSCQLSTSLLPHDAVSALGPMYHVHEKSHLPKLLTCDRSISKLFEASKVKKNEMNLFVHQFMLKVVHVQSILKDVRLQFPAFKAAMERQEDYFSPLKVVRGIAPAYRACFAEIIRRKSSKKLYMGLAGQWAEKMAIEREVEVRKRAEFFRTQSIYFHDDILVSMGLLDSPKQCDVNIAPFDTKLLNIDIMDLDRFAPKYLVGVPPKKEKNTLARSNLATSTDNSDLVETDGISSVTDEDINSGETHEGYGSVEIAGTSKLEVENALLKAELASTIALLCSVGQDAGIESVDDEKLRDVLESTAEKTAEALRLKDEYSKHIHSMLKAKQMQCAAYEKRIQELEQRLDNNYRQGQKTLTDKNTQESSVSSLRTTYWKTGMSEPMDEVSSSSGLFGPKLEQFTRFSNKSQEDENMTDLFGTSNMPSGDFFRNSMDSSMLEIHQDQQVGDEDREVKTNADLRLTFTNQEVMDDQAEHVLSSPSKTAVSEHSKAKDDLVLELKNELSDKSCQHDETETKLKAALDDVNSFKKELEVSRKLLDESLMNCVHLENCLHEAREQAHTNLCAADRKASEYNALRTSAVKMHGLFERFRSCVTASVAVASFADSLCSLAHSLASSATEDEDDVAKEFRTSIKVLADKVSFLSRQRSELLDRCSRAEAAHGHLLKEVEEKKESVKSLYSKLQLEKQANKEKLSFGCLEVHELAAFVLNPNGHYEAINRSFSNYYLSAESVALFVEQRSSKPTYIIGQVVHIERQVVKSPTSVHSDHSSQIDFLSCDASNRPSPGSRPVSASNPYDLPIGCEYFIVTVAMLPDTICQLPDPVRS